MSSILPRLLPSMTDLAFVMPLIFLYCGMQGARTLLSDGDTGWHLRTGEWILAHGRVPDHDIFSFTRPGQPWFAWEWLWDAGFGWLHVHAGMAAVVWANSLILALTFALLFRVARRRSEPAVALIFTLIAAAASAGHWLARPHLCTMLFTVVFYAVLEGAGASARGRRRLWLLLPLMILWTNLHGGFFTGIALIAIYAAGAYLALLRETSDSERRQALRHGRSYLLAAAGCSLATLANPYFLRLHVHILKYLLDGFYRVNIMEFQPLNFQTGQARHFEVLLACGAAAVFGQLRRGQFTGALLFAVWAHLALYSARNVEIFALLAAVPAAAAASEFLRRAPELRAAKWLRAGLLIMRELMRDWSALDRAPRWQALSLAAMLTLAVLLGVPRAPAAWTATYDPRTFPVAAADRLEQAGVFGGVFTEDLWGGYLIYRQYPRGRVFIDGRSDFYGPEFVGSYIRAWGAQSGWERYLSRYGVDTVLLPVNAPLAGALKQSSAWHLTYDDGLALIFRTSQAFAFPLTQVSAAPPRGENPIATIRGKNKRL